MSEIDRLQVSGGQEPPNTANHNGATVGTAAVDSSCVTARPSPTNIVTPTTSLRASLKRKRLLILINFTMYYLAVTLLLAEQKLIWSDEFFTLYLSRLPDLATLWDALSTGGDQHPPLFYMIVRASLSMFGENEVALRLPSVIGFWVMCLSLYIFVSKRTTPVYGLLAMVLPTITKAHWYAYEARGYALMLGFSGLALVCWQAAAENRQRTWAIPGLAISLAAAVGSHYYAVLVLLPLAMGELVRIVTTRRINYWAWIALCGGGIPLLVFLPVIRSARGFSEHFWAKPKLIKLLWYPELLLGWGVAPLIACLCVVAIWILFRPVESGNEGEQQQLQPNAAEIVAAIGLLASPMFAMLLAKTVTSGFHMRYSLFSVEGLSIIFAFVAYRLLKGRTGIGTALVVTLQCWFLMAALLGTGAESRNRRDSVTLANMLQTSPHAELPLVFSESELWYRFTYYNHFGVGDRSVFLADPEKSIVYLGHDTIDRCALTLKPWFQLPVEPYEEFIDTHEQFLVYTDLNANWNWVTTALLADDIRLKVVSRNGERVLFLASRPDAR